MCLPVIVKFIRRAFSIQVTDINMETPPKTMAHIIHYYAECFIETMCIHCIDAKEQRPVQ